MSTFDFSAVLDQYVEPFIRIDAPAGRYAPNGLWQPGGDPVEVPMEGVVLPLSASDLRYDEAGTWSRDDRKLYVETPLSLGQQIKHKGHLYTVQAEANHDTHGGYFLYFCRRERATGEGTKA